MYILTINSGSSSLRFRLFKMTKTPSELAVGHIDGIGIETCRFTFKTAKKNIGQNFEVKNHKEAIALCLETLTKTKVIDDIKEIEAVGHRVVHGGEKYTEPTKITKPVLSQIEKLSYLAPLHNPANIEGIKACQELLKKAKQVAVFDTAFHKTMPEKAYKYGLPEEYYSKHQIRRYGFHGTSHKFVIDQAIKLTKNKKAKIISCHLGNGCSLTASESGKSLDTSMGMTPLEGPIMGTRSGNIDPGILLHLNKEFKMSMKQIDKLLNHESGLKAISEISSDMRHIYEASKKKDKKAIFAIEIFCYTIAKYIGAYTATLNGIDTLVFTGGIGEKAFYVREQICQYLEYLGVTLDKTKNKKCAEEISSKKSKVNVLVIPTNEELQIAKETQKII